MERSAQLPVIEEIAAALGAVVTNGLPLPHDYSDERLLKLPCVQKRCESPSDRVKEIAVLEAVLNESLADFSDDSRRDALRALFGVAAGARQKKVSDRRTLAAREMDREKEHFRKRIEPTLIDGLAMQLYRRCIVIPPADDSLVALGPNCIAVLRQLYRYAQDLVLIVEVYQELSLCSSWLGKGDNRYAAQARGFPGRFRVFADEALWTYAHCRRYLDEIMGDAVSREFLREHVSTQWWKSSRMRACLDEAQSGRLAESLASAVSDDPRELIGNLDADLEGSVVHSRWLRMLSCYGSVSCNKSGGCDEDLSSSRWVLARDLLEVCAALQHIFPDSTLGAREAEAHYRFVMETVGNCGLLESGVPMDDSDGSAAFSLVAKVYDRRPQRYRSGISERVEWPARAWG